MCSATASTANVPDTIELCKHAADHGADGVIVSPPYYVKGISNEGMLRYYTMVLDGLPKSLPFYLYHVPRWSVAPIPVEVVKQLRRYGNVAGAQGFHHRRQELRQLHHQLPGHEHHHRHL